MAESTRHDTFCWECCVQNTTLQCSNCRRSFHSECVGYPNLSDEELWRCPICFKLDASIDTDDKECLDKLTMMINRVLNEEKFASLTVPLKGAKSDSLVNPIDLMEIKKRINSYTSFFEFLTDIQWIVHNCSILFSGKHDMVKTAKSLKKYTEMEIKSIKTCTECYSNANKYPTEWCTMVCSKVHIVVWGKVVGYNYWPGKCMSIDSTGQLVNVRFFGDHTEADIAATNCFLYSTKNPSSRPVKSSDTYKSALKDADKYIKNIRNKFGQYELAKKKTPFNPSLLDKYLLDAIPGAGNSQTPPDVSEDIANDNSNVLVNDLHDQTYSSESDDSSTLPTGAQLNESLSIDSSASGSVVHSDSLGDSEHNDRSNSDDNLRPGHNVQTRFAHNTGFIQKKVEFDYKADINADTNIVPAKDFREYRNSRPIANDPESTADGWNLAECIQVMKESTEKSNKAFDFVCGLNTKLEADMKALTTKHDDEVKNLGEQNQQLIDAHAATERADKKLIDELTMKIGRLEMEKLKHDEERTKAVNEAKEQCQEDFARRLEANKKMKFCMSCDAAKQQDTFYICSDECHKRYCMQMDK